MVLWDYVPNKSSRNDIVKAMKVNLELVNHEDITEFSFSINEPYEKKVIGEGPYSSTGTYKLLPDFTGDTEQQARATASRLGISVSFSGSSGTVISQSYPANKRVDLMKETLVLTLSGGKDVSDVDTTNKKNDKTSTDKSDKAKKTDDDDDDDNSNSNSNSNNKDDDNNNSNSNNNTNNNDSGSNDSGGGNDSDLVP